ncbi:MAG: DMT family transporter [Paracoccaceae bacterium]|nr:DMT family transporter [Paracoccaceae bacterium]MDG2451938.1 DMT family transporter [Paracoccaceae bacterium]
MTQTSPNRPIAGIIWMMLTGLLFVGVTAVVKHLGDDIPAAQSAFLRYVLGLVFVIPMIRPMWDAGLSSRQLRLFGIRGVVHTAAVILWFYAMTQIPIAEVTAMNYLSPVYVTLAAALFLGERLRPRRIVAIVVALLGALIILRPGLRELNSGHLAMLLVAVMFAAGYLIAKIMSSEVSPIVVVGMLSITVTIGLAPFAWAVWVPVSGIDLAWLFLVAVLATAGHYTMTRAFEAAPVTVTQPVTFLQLVWATALGALVFGEGVDAYVVLGGALILSAVCFIAWREAVARRQATAEDRAAKA